MEFKREEGKLIQFHQMLCQHEGKEVKAGNKENRATTMFTQECFVLQLLCTLWPESGRV